MSLSRIDIVTPLRTVRALNPKVGRAAAVRRFFTQYPDDLTTTVHFHCGGLDVYLR